MYFNSDPYANLRRMVQAPLHVMKSFELQQPFATHYRIATCREAECKSFREGMSVTFDLTIPDQVALANWMRNRSGLRYTYTQTGSKVQFLVPAGQDGPCLRARLRPHRVPLERDPFMIVRAGDFRGNPTGQRSQETRPELFVEQWAEDLDKLKTVHDRG